MGRGMVWGRSKLLPAVLLATVVVAACGDDDTASTERMTGADRDEPSGTTETTDLPRCTDAKQLVFFSINEFLTTLDQFAEWADAYPEYSMEVRPGAVELTNAYHDRGYELMYATRGGTDLDINGTPYGEALPDWLDSAGFPTGERTRLVYEGSTAKLIDEFLAWSSEGGSVHTGYTNGESDVPALLTGGAPREQVYTMGQASGVDDTTELEDSDLEAHLDALGEPEAICSG